MGERLTARLRVLLFRAILKQEMAFFDDQEYNSGALVTRLAVDATAVKGLAGQRIGVTFANICTLIAGVAIAFNADWKIALVSSPALMHLVDCAAIMRFHVRRSLLRSRL